jgi:hypothetical protein
MNSLQDLNNFGATAIDVADSRPAGVVFDRLFPSVPEEQILTITSTSVAVGPGIEIEEIINYELANVRYQIKIFSGSGNPLPASSLDWPPFIANVTLTQVGNVYTISGLTSDQDWREVRNFIWDLPNDYLDYPLWYLEASIIYYDDLLDQELTKSWVVYDPRFYYVAQLEAESNMIANAKTRYSATINMSATFTQREFFIELDSKSTMNVVGDKFKGVGSNTLTTTANLNVTSYIFDKAQAIISASSSLSCVARRSIRPILTFNSVFTVPNINAIDYRVNYNFTSTRTYRSNSKNALFTSLIPYLGDPRPNEIYTVNFTTPNGYFGTNSNLYAFANPFTYTGTVSQINSLISELQYYPNKDFISNTSFTFTQIKNGVTVSTRTASINHTTLGGFATRLYNFNTPTTSIWTAQADEYLYCRMDYLIVGGGGGAANTQNGGGGGGGQVRFFSNQSINLSPYPYTVGAGGGFFSNGGDSVFNSLTAFRGLGATGRDGAFSGSGFAGGTGTAGAGGGGGGDTAVGKNPRIFTGASFGGYGGAGTSSNITGTNIAYGRGGEGAYSMGQQAPSRVLNLQPGSGGFGRHTSGDFPDSNKPATTGISGAVIIKIYRP